MKRACAAALFLLLVAPSLVWAEFWATATLEWLADHCRDSGIYTVVSVQKESVPQDPSQKPSYIVSLKLTRVLRGEPPQEVT